VAVVKADELRELVQRIYVAHGVRDSEAEVVSRHQVGANLAGHDSHGVMRTQQYLGAIKKGDLVPDAEFVIERETPTTAVINGNWGFGFVMTERAMQLAIEKASAHGSSGITIRFQGHVGRLGAYTAMAAEDGLIAMMM
jgi:LDH2 family malate/lactate/ureidoglycolate dehydrogenase